MKKISYIVFCWLVLLVSKAYAVAPAQQLSDLLNQTRTMQANFTQTTYDNKGKAIQQGRGQMALWRPGRFRWEVKKPLPQVIIANTTRLWIYDPDLEQVTIRPLKQTTGEAPALLLSHVNAVFDKDFIVSQPESKASDLQWFLLTPRSRDNVFASVKLGFLNKQIKEMRLADHLGHETLIQFKNIKTNLALSESLFTFKPTANIDVINETKRHLKPR